MSDKAKTVLSVGVVASVLSVAASYFYLWHIAPLSVDQRTGISTAIATGILGIVAAVALGANVYQAKQTKRAVDAATAQTAAAVAETEAVKDQTGALLRQAQAAELQAEASDKQAKASQAVADEARLTRDLEWQPLLNWDRKGRIWNTGHGHAYRAVVAFRVNDRLMQVSRPIPVGLSSSNEITDWIDWPDPPGGILPRGTVWAVFGEIKRGRTIDSSITAHDRISQRPVMAIGQP